MKVRELLKDYSGYITVLKHNRMVGFSLHTEYNKDLYNDLLNSESTQDDYNPVLDKEVNRMYIVSETLTIEAEA